MDSPGLALDEEIGLDGVLGVSVGVVSMLRKRDKSYFMARMADDGRG